jgi:hypothetical protein
MAFLRAGRHVHRLDAVTPGGPMMGSDATRPANHLSRRGEAGGGSVRTSGGMRGRTAGQTFAVSSMRERSVVALPM